MEQTEQLNTFEGFLNTLVQDFGGIEIFSEENESRLNKVVKSQADSFLQEKKWMLIAGMENIPQKLYSVMEFPQEAQQKMIDNSLDELSSLGLTPQVCENVISSFISVLKLKGSATKMPEIEKIMGEMELDGEIYKTCQIGKQIWMAENHRVSAFGPNTWDSGRTCGMAVPGYKYGRVYTRWEAGYYGEEDGWHLPSVEDWLELVQYIESLGFDAGTALKSVGDWGGKADPGLDLFGFAAHPLKFWDDNYPEKKEIKRYPKESLWPAKLNKYADEAEIGNRYLDMSKVSQFPCIQFWTSTKYVDNPCVDDGTEMAYVATLGDFNKVDLDGGKVSCSGRVYSPYIPFGFACVRFVKNIK